MKKVFVLIKQTMATYKNYRLSIYENGVSFMVSFKNAVFHFDIILYRDMFVAYIYASHSLFQVSGGFDVTLITCI